MTDHDKKENDNTTHANIGDEDAVENESTESPNSVDEKAVTVVEPSEVPQGSATGVPQEALVQLKKLSALREQELERQERLINQMQDVVGRHSRTNKTLLGICLITLVLVGVLSFSLMKLGTGQSATTKGLNKVSENVDAAVDLMRRRSDEEIRKIGALQSSVSTKLVDSVDAMRRERDEIKDEVRSAIDAHDLNMRNREVALKDEEKRIAKEAEITRKNRLKIVGDAIDRLSQMAHELEADDEESGEITAGASGAGDDTIATGAILAEESLNGKSDDAGNTLGFEAVTDPDHEVDASTDVSAAAD